MKKICGLMCVLMMMAVFGVSQSYARRRASYKPMPVRSNVDIPNGEYIMYSIYVGGEKAMEFRMVTTYTDKTLVKTYMDLHMIGEDIKVPDHYTKYPWYAKVNLETASMTRYVQDETHYYVDQNLKKGIHFMDVSFGNEIRAVTRTWDGYESRQSISRSRNVDISYPVWLMAGFNLWGSRLLNWEEGGVVYIWDSYLKDPVLSSMNILGRDTLKSDIGMFEVDKIGFRVADPFLGALLRQFTDSITFWVERGPKRRLLKIEIEAGDQTWIMEDYKILAVD
jgi:hypothetical protein